MRLRGTRLRTPRELLVVVALAASVIVVSGDARALEKGDELDLSGCMWSADSRYDGAADGFGGIDRYAYYGVQYLRANVPGGHFRFRGRFPRARYFGFQVYDEVGQPISYVPDSAMEPNRGSVNPFRDGVAYQRGKVSYTLDLVDAPLEKRKKRHILYGGYRGDGRAVNRQAIEYRIYLPDRSDRRTIPGGVPMPRVSWVVTDPRTTAYRTAAEACADNQSGATFRTVYAADQAMVAINPTLHETRMLGLGQNPPRWTVSVQEECCFPLYPNLETAYLAASIAPPQGQVLAYRFKLPTYADTERGELISQTQVRYWSFCTLQGGNFFYTDACLYDAQVHPDANGFVTLALSSPADRPVVGRRLYADWLPYPGGGPMVFVRYIDSARRWRESPFRMPREPWWGREDGDGQLRELMKEYYPVGVYCSRVRFETDRCGLGARKSSR